MIKSVSHLLGDNESNINKRSTTHPGYGTCQSLSVWRYLGCSTLFVHFSMSKYHFNAHFQVFSAKTTRLTWFFTRLGHHVSFMFRKTSLAPNTLTYTFISIHTNTQIHTFVHICMHIYAPHACLLVLILIHWQQWSSVESKVDQLSSSAECRVHTYIHAHPHMHACMHTYMWVVVNFDDLAQARDFRIEMRQVVFLCWVQDSNPGSQTPNHQQTECPLKNRLSYRGSSEKFELDSPSQDQRAFKPNWPHCRLAFAPASGDIHVWCC